MHRKSVYLLVLAVASLLVLGVVMLYSTSAYARDFHAHGNPYYFIQRQCIWLGIGLLGCVIASRIDYHFWERTAWFWYGLAILLLILCLIPQIGLKVNGARRWLNLHVATFQPSELAKLAAVVALGRWFSRNPEATPTFWKGFVLPLGIAGGLMALIAPEIDMGTTCLIGATAYLILFVAGTRMRYLAPFAALGIGAMIFALSLMPVRMGRMMAFMDPQAHPKEAYQQVQGIIALASGGVEGLGLGNGRQKIGYLPFAHTDFIFPIIGEELGLLGTLATVFFYIVIIMCGVMISINAKDKFGLLLGFGIVCLIALQAAVNIGVTTSLLPNKGLPLPFISYGGTNLALCLLFVGILINIYRKGANESDQRAASVRLAVRTKSRRAVRI